MKLLFAFTVAVVALSCVVGADARRIDNAFEHAEDHLTSNRKRGLLDKIKTGIQKGIDGTQTGIQKGIDKIMGNADHDEGLLRNTWDGIRKGVKLRHYSPSNQNAAIISFDAKTNEFSCATCDKNLPFVLYAHGFRSSPETKFVELHNDRNVILLDWISLSKQELMYVPAAKNAVDVGRYVGKMFAALSNKLGVAGSQIHLVGHSLGAHLVGNAARTFAKERNGEQIGRLTALDPAGPSWMDGQKLSAIPELFANKLRNTDAFFIDVVHTNAHMKPCLVACDPVALGILHELGHADFYVGNVKFGNVALQQPGCDMATVLNTGCSHINAVHYYTKTFSAGQKYPGWKCSSIDNCQKGVVNKDDVNYMGEQAKKPAQRSLYYVEIEM